MSRVRISAYWVPNLLFFLIFVLGFLPCIWCVDGNDDYDSPSNKSSISPFVTSLIYSQISNFTSVFNKNISTYLGFCIKDVDADWNGAFNFSNNLEFVTNCIKQIKGICILCCQYLGLI
ncbi:hypothetical protein ACSBR1_035750 [Camellia fascicularis]